MRERNSSISTGTADENYSGNIAVYDNSMYTGSTDYFGTDTDTGSTAKKKPKKSRCGLLIAVVVVIVIIAAAASNPSENFVSVENSQIVGKWRESWGWAHYDGPCERYYEFRPDGKVVISSVEKVTGRQVSQSAYRYKLKRLPDSDDVPMFGMYELYIDYNDGSGFVVPYGSGPVGFFGEFGDDMRWPGNGATPYLAFLLEY